MDPPLLQSYNTALSSLPQEILDEIPKKLDSKQDLVNLARAHRCFRVGTREEIFHSIDIALQCKDESIQAARANVLVSTFQRNPSLKKLVKFATVFCIWENGAIVLSSVSYLLRTIAFQLIELDIELRINVTWEPISMYRHKLFEALAPITMPSRMAVQSKTLNWSAGPFACTSIFRNLETIHELLGLQGVEHVTVTLEQPHLCIADYSLSLVRLPTTQYNLKSLDLADVPISVEELEDLCEISVCLEELSVTVGSPWPDRFPCSPKKVSLALEHVATTVQSLRLMDRSEPGQHDGTMLNLWIFEKLRTLEVQSLFLFPPFDMDKKADCLVWQKQQRGTSLWLKLPSSLENFRIDFFSPSAIFAFGYSWAEGLDEVLNAPWDKKYAFHWIEHIIEYNRNFGGCLRTLQLIEHPDDYDRYNGSITQGPSKWIGKIERLKEKYMMRGVDLDIRLRPTW